METYHISVQCILTMKSYPLMKEHFKDHYNSIFIALLHFFQLDRMETGKVNQKKLSYYPTKKR